ncbi:MAG: hypothetical protein CSB34_02010 [Desulfobulbus propionicus]|nr:MAG: hypothetical protein CSB34_02010 [Desulfobulbus propionicus]PIE63665.1 MAG: hypothetical protein CSA26_11845 [Desulfobacterales bacterium]
MNDKRRTAKRVIFNTSAQVRHGNDQQITATVQTNNISLKGIFLDCATQLPLDTECEVTLSLKGATSAMEFHVSGRVCRNEPDGFAIAFTKLNPDSYAHITNLLVMEANKEK